MLRWRRGPARRFGLILRSRPLSLGFDTVREDEVVKKGWVRQPFGSTSSLPSFGNRIYSQTGNVHLLEETSILLRPNGPSFSG